MLWYNFLKQNNEFKGKKSVDKHYKYKTNLYDLRENKI